MSETIYSYSIEGLAAHGQTWETSGRVAGSPGQFPDLVHEAIRQSFIALTHGKAVYGLPGIGCNGPYQVIRFTLAKEVDA